MGSPVINEAINIAMQETVALQDYLAGVRSTLEVAGFKTVVSAADAAAAVEALRTEVINYENQSAVDISKPQRLLGGQPTPFSECIASTTNWHLPLLTQAQKRFPSVKGERASPTVK